MLHAHSEQRMYDSNGLAVVIHFTEGVE
jgi:hypothetical protein